MEKSEHTFTPPPGSEPRSNKTPAADAAETTRWHDAYRCSMRLGLARYADVLYFTNEYILNDEPNRADQIIVRKLRDVPLDDVIAEYFLGYNVMEYKSPGDHLGECEFMRSISYCSLLSSYGFNGERVRSKDVTLSLFREARPKALLEFLGSCGEIINPHPGIYRVPAGLIFPVQVVAYGEMTDEAGHVLLRSLTRSLTDEMSARLCEAVSEYAPGDAEVPAIENLLRVIYEANKSFKKGVSNMLEWMQSMVEPMTQQRIAKAATESEARGKASGMAIGIISTMHDLGCGDSDIINRLMLKLGCDSSTAARMVAEYVS